MTQTPRGEFATLFAATSPKISPISNNNINNINNINNQDEPRAEGGQDWPTLIGFWICGLINNFGYSVMLSAGLDILENGEGKSVEAGFVLLADIVPTFIVKISAPFFMAAIPYKYRVYTVVFSSISSFYIVAFAPSIPLKLFGVAIGSFASGLGEISFLALTSWYSKTTVSAWSSGTGGAGIAGALLYAVWTSVFKIAPRTALVQFSFCPLLMLIGYLVMSEGRDPASSASPSSPRSYALTPMPMTSASPRSPRSYGPTPAPATPRAPSPSLSGTPTPRTPLAPSLSVVESRRLLDEIPDIFRPLSDDAELAASEGAMSPRTAPVVDESTDALLPATAVVDATSMETLNFQQKLKLMIPLLRYMGPLFLVYYGEYLINQGILPTIFFPDGPVPTQRDSYVWFQAAYQSGVFISRSSVSLVQIRRLYIPALLQMVNVILLALHAYGIPIFPNLYTVVALVFWEGLLGGSTYVSGFTRISIEVRAMYREFALGVVSVADTTGIVCASISGIFLERSILRHRS